MQKRVVVTGIGVVCANASNAASFQTALFNGVSGIQSIPVLEDYGFRCLIGGIAQMPEITEGYFSIYNLDRASDFIQLACVAGVEAWKNAGLSVSEADSDEVDWDTGVIIGAGTPGIEYLEKKIIPYTNSGQVRRIGGYGTLNTIVSGPAIWLSSILGVGNISVGNSMACASGVDAIAEGFHRIASGRARRMVVGSTDAYSPYYWAPFDSLRVLNSRMNDRPTEASRPMSASACGFVPSSGAGVLILEDLETAIERNAPILAEIKAGVSNCGGQKNGGTATFPNGEGVKRCIQDTLDASGMDRDEIDLINAHLTSTKGDPFEMRSWVSVFGTDNFPIVNTTKSLLGHSLVAAGAIESVASIIQLQNNFVHPSLNCEDLHPEIAALIPDTSIVTGKSLKKEINAVMKASFGFGDVNSSVIFKKFSS